MSTPAGWYDDGHGALRWWDGTTWTEHVHAHGQQDTPAAAEPASDIPASDIPAAEEPVAGATPAAAPYEGYPGYPGAGTNTSAPYAAAYTGASYAPTGAAGETSAKKSKLWILFVVLGVVAIGMIALAAFFIPRAISAFTGGMAASDAPTQAAIDAVYLYDEAWSEGDCDKYFTATTESFRNVSGMTDCATFTEESSYFQETTDDYAVTIEDTTVADGVVVVETTEDFTSTIDANGDTLDEPKPFSQTYIYYVVDTGAGWAIEQAE